MNLNIDSAIFIGLLIVNLIVGLSYGRGTKTVSNYALGERNFSTGALSSTIVATWIGGGFFSIALSETYKQGLF